MELLTLTEIATCALPESRIVKPDTSVNKCSQHDCANNNSSATPAWPRARVRSEDGHPRSGKCTLLLSKLKWLGAECFSTSSIGRKIRRRCSLRSPNRQRGRALCGRHCLLRNGSVDLDTNNHVARSGNWVRC